METINQGFSPGYVCLFLVPGLKARVSHILTVPAKGISLNKIPLYTNSGYYVVKVVGDTRTKTGKVFIN